MPGPYCAEENEAWRCNIATAMEAQQVGDVDGYLAVIRTILTQFELVDGMEARQEVMLALLQRLKHERKMRAVAPEMMGPPMPPPV